MILVCIDYEKIYQEYYQRIYMFLYRLSGSSEIAEELTSETFIEAYRALFWYGGENALYTRLLKEAKDVFFDYLANSDRSYMTVDLYVLDPESPITEEAGHRITKEISTDKLREVLLTMPEHYTDIPILKIYAELSFGEIADELGLSEQTVKTVFYRAKQQIKEELIDENV